MSTEHNHSGGAPAGYETRDANPESLIKFAITLAVTVVVAMGGMWWLLGYFNVVQPAGPAATPFTAIQERQFPPLPRIQVDPMHDIAQVRAVQNSSVDSYGWVDRAHGVVRIPVEQAMDMILARGGLPARQAPESAGAAPAAKPKPRKGTP